MRELGLMSKQIDFIQGRVGKGIFVQHYFEKNLKVFSERVISLLPRLEKSFLNLIPVS